MFPRLLDDQWIVDAQVAFLANAGRPSGLMVCPMVLLNARPAGNEWTFIYEKAAGFVAETFGQGAFPQSALPSRN